MATAVEILLQGVDQLSGPVEQAKGALGGLSSVADMALGVFTGGALLEGATAIVGKLGELAGSPLDAWRNLDEAADTLTMKLGVTGPALDAMTGSVSNLYNSSAGLGQSMGDIASTMGTLGQITGATGPALESLTSQLGYMKQVQGEGAVGAEEFARTLQAWNIPAEQGGALLDQMAVATQKFGISSADMTSGLQKAAGAFQGMGLSADQSMGLMAGFYAGGLNTEKAIMAMSTAAGKFAKDGVDMRTGLDQAVQAIQHAGTATEATKIAVETFGAKAGPGLATAIQQGKFSLEGLSATLGNTTGALQKTAEATMDFPEKMELMKRKVETALEPLGQAIANGLGSALDALGPLLNSAVAGFAPLIQRVTDASQLFQTAGEWSSSFGETILRVTETLLGLQMFSLDGLTGTIDAAANAAGALQLAFQFFATGDTDSAFEMLGEALQGVIGMFGLTNDASSDLANGIMGPLQDAFEGVGTIARTVFGALPGIVAGLMPGITALASFITSTVTQAFQTLGPIASAVFAGIVTVVTNVMPSVVQLAGAVGQTLSAAFTAMQQIATAVFTALQPYLPALQSAISQVSQVLGTTLNSALQGISSFLTGTVIPAISTFAGWLSANLPGAIAAVAGFIQNQLIPAFNTIQSLINQYVVPALSGLAGVLNGPVGQAVKDVAGFVANVLVAAWQGFVNFIQGAMPTMSGAVDGAFKIIGGAIQTVSGILQVVAAVVHGIITGDWAGAWEDAQAGVQTAIDGIKQILNGAIEEVTAIVVSIMNGIVSAITGKQTDVVQVMGDAARAAWDGFQNAVTNWAQLGVDIIRGIIQGVEDKAGDMARSVADAARNALDSAKAALGIQSPSAVAASEIGQPLAAGIAVGIMAGGDLVAEGLRALLSGGLAAGVDAMHQLASAFREVFKAFQGESEGLGGNAFSHVKRLIDSISSITSTVGDFLKMLNDLQTFAGTAAAGMVTSAGGRSALVWLFDMIASLAKEMAVSARNAAAGFINSEVGGALGGVASAVQGIKTLVDAVVGSVSALVGIGGTGIEHIMNDAAAQQWIDNLLGGIIYLAVGLKVRADQVIGAVSVASPSLSNLSGAMQPLSSLITSTVGAIGSILNDVGGKIIEKVMNDAAAREWIDNLMGGIIFLAIGLKDVAERAAGKIPEASTSLANLGTALQPFTVIISSVVSIITGLHDILSNSVVQGATTGPMAELWSALYEFIAQGLVRFAAGLKAAAEVAAGQIPAASASLANLSNAITPMTTIVGGSVKLITDLHALINDTIVKGATTGPMSMVWAGLYEFIAQGLVAFAAGLKAAVEAAVGVVPAAGASLGNLNNALQPFSGVITSTVGAIKALGDVASDDKLLALLGGQGASINQQLYELIATKLVEFAVKIAAAAEAAVGTVPAATASLGNLSGALTPLSNVITAILGVWTTWGDNLTKIDALMAVIAGPLQSGHIVHVITELVRFAGDVARSAGPAVGDVAAATTSLGNLSSAVQPLSNVLSSILGVWTTYADNHAKLDALMAVLINPLQSGHVVHVITLVVGFAGDVARAAGAAVGDVAAASKSLSNLSGALTPLSSVLDSSIGVWSAYIKNRLALDALMAVLINPLQSGHIVHVITELVRFAGDVARSANGAVGDVGEANKSLSNLASALTPLSSVFESTMGLFGKLGDWTPVDYSVIQTKVDSLINSLKQVATAVSTAAHDAGISEAMATAAKDLLDVAGSGMDALGKAMATIKSLFEFKIENGPGWLQMQGGNNIWSTGSSTPGIPDASAVTAKVTQLMTALKAIVDSIKAGVTSIDLGADPATLQAKLAGILSIVQSAAALIQAVHDLVGTTGNGKLNLSIAIAVAFNIPSLSDEIAKIPVPTIHVPVVYDLPDGSTVGNSGGGGTDTLTKASGNSGSGTTITNNVNVNLSTAAGLTGTLALLTNMAAG